MMLYAWIDENGNWRVSHFPPNDGSATLQIDCAPGTSVVFRDHATFDEISVGVRP